MKKCLPNNAGVAILKFLFASCLILCALVQGHAQNSTGNQMDLAGLSSADSAKPVAAFALRRLSTAYTGPLVRIRFGTGKFYDVYPDASGNQVFSLTSKVSATDAVTAYNSAVQPASASTLASVLSSNATVAVWYDQSGTGNNNAYQATSGNQPTIISGSAIVTMGINDRPAISFNAAGNNTLITTGYNVSQLNGKCTYGMSIIATASSSNAFGARMLSMKASDETSDISYVSSGQRSNGSAMAVNGYDMFAFKQQYNSGTFSSAISTSPVSMMNFYGQSGTLGCDFRAYGVTHYQNGVIKGSFDKAWANNDAYAKIQSATMGVGIGSNMGGGNFFTGSISEVLVFASQLNSISAGVTDRNAFVNNQATYFSIAMPGPAGIEYTNNHFETAGLTNITFNTNKNIVVKLAPTVGTGTVPASFSLTGTLPDGLSFSTTNGLISGTPTAATTASGFTVTCSNATGTATQDIPFSIVVSDVASFSATDFPATKPVVLYSLRKLNANYIGPVIRVRRSGDNVSKDFYFVGTTLDQAAIIAFCTAGGGTRNGSVSVWYDQSGNGIDAYQSVTANQPGIVVAGVMNLQNTKPTITFTGSGSLNSMPPNGLTSVGFGNNFSANVVGAFSSGSASNSILFAAKAPQTSVAAGSDGYSVAFVRKSGPTTNIQGFRGGTGNNTGLTYTANQLFTATHVTNNIAALSGQTYPNNQHYVDSLSLNTSALALNSVNTASSAFGYFTAVPNTSLFYIAGGNPTWQITYGLGSDMNGGSYLTGNVSEAAFFSTNIGYVSRTSLSNSQVTYYNLTGIAAPAGLSYDKASTLVKNVSINTIPVEIFAGTGGTPTSYSISPSLPSGLTFNTTTGTISGTPIVASALTNYTVTGTNNIGSSSCTYRLSVIDSKGDLGLTNIPAPLAAYSLRKINSLYTGYAIRVIRSSDNTQQDIGFDAQGELDLTALTAFVPSGNGFVSVWYDQSGNNQDLYNNPRSFQPYNIGSYMYSGTSATSTMPYIVRSGVVQKKNGKPTLDFSTSSNSYSCYLQTAKISAASLANVKTASVIGSMEATTSGVLMSTFSSTGESSTSDWILNSSGNAIAFDANQGFTKTSGGVYINGSVFKPAGASMVIPQGSGKLFGGSFLKGSVSTPSPFSNGLIIGAVDYPVSRNWRGYVSEVILLPTLTTQPFELEADQAAYYVNEALSSSVTTSTCSGSAFTYVATVETEVAPITTIAGTYTWSRAAVTIGGTLYPAASGTTATITGTFVNTTGVIVTVPYTVTFTPAVTTNFSITKVISVTVNPTATIKAVVMTPVCSGSIFALTPTGTIPNETTYSWSAPATLSGTLSGGVSATGQATVNGILLNTTNLSATALYTVTATTGAGCTSSFTATVTINPTPAIGALTIPAVCTGAVFVFTPTGSIPAGSTYSWSAPATTLGGGASATTQNRLSGTLTNLTSTAAAALYTVTATYAGCASSFTASVSVNPRAVIGAQALGITCSNSSFTFTPTGTIPAATIYSWNAPVASIGTVSGGAAASNQNNISGVLTNAASSAAAAEYIITASNAGCTSSFTSTVTVNPKAIIDAQATPLSVCTNNGFIFTPSGVIPAATTYSWNAPTMLVGSLSGGVAGSDPNIISGTLANPGTTTATAMYTITATTADACTSLFTRSVSVDQVLANNVIQTTNAAPCFAANADIINEQSAVTGGSSTYTYLWESSTGGSFATASGTNNLISYDPGVLAVATSFRRIVSGGACASLVSNILLVTPKMPLAIGTQPVALNTIANNTSVTITAVGSQGSGAYTYQWYSNSSNSNTAGTIIPGANSSGYSVPPTTVVGDRYYYTVITDAGCGNTITSTVAVVNTLDPLIFVTEPLSQIICNNVPAGVNVIVSGGSANYAYQWLETSNNIAVNGITLTGETAAAYSVLATATGGPRYYYVVVTDAVYGTTIVSTTAGITTRDALSIQTAPSSKIICNNTTVDITVAGAGAALSYTYKWFSNPVNSSTGGSEILSEINATYTVPATLVPGNRYYYATVSDLVCGSTVTSTAAQIFTRDPLSIQTEPAAQVVCNNTPVIISVVGAGGSGGSNYTYQWYINSSNNTTGGTPIPVNGALSSYSVAPTLTTGSVYYYVSVTDGGCGSMVTSTTADIYTRPTLTVSAQPLSQTICNNTIANLSIAASGGSGAANYSYQWYSNSSNTSTGGSVISGETTLNYTAPATVTAGNRYYYVTITDLGCNTPFTSSVATVTTREAFVFQAPFLLSSYTICNDFQLNLTAAATGGTLSYTYQWYSNTTSSTAGSTALTGTGSTSSTYPIAANLSAGDKYYYVVISDAACNTSITSIISKVTTRPVFKIDNITGSVAICNNTARALQVLISGGSSNYSYQWYSNTGFSNLGGTLIPGATGSSYTVPATFTSGDRNYYVKITDLVCTGVLTSDPMTVFTTPPLTINAQPIAQVICNNTPVTLRATAGGSFSNFQSEWYESATGSFVDGVIIPGTTSGATTIDYTVPATTAAGNRYYYVKFFDNICQTIRYTSIVAVTTKNVLSIATQPLSQNICYNTPVTLTAASTGGSFSYTYQWYSNTTNSSVGGTVISGEVSLTYAVPPTTSVGNRYYYLTITDVACNATVTSTTAAIYTANVLSQGTAPASLSVCSNTTATITAGGAGGSANYEYQWYSNTTNSSVGGTLLPGATSASYVVPATIVGGNRYFYATITDVVCGATINTAVSRIGNYDALIIASQPVASQIILDNAVTVLNISVTGGSSNYQYQWYESADNTYSGTAISIGASNASYTVPVKGIPGTRYFYVATSDNQCTSTVTSIISEVITVSSLTVGMHPLSQTICNNTAVDITVAGALGSLSYTYQWYTNTTSTTAGATPVNGATAATYTVPAVTATVNRYYYAVITDAILGTNVTTNIAEIITRSGTPVTINVQPAAQTGICVNGTINLSVQGAGGSSGAFDYQWYSNTSASNAGGTLLNGETAPTFNKQITAQGVQYFYVTVRDPDCGNALPSIVATVQANAIPAIVISSNSQTVCQNTSGVPVTGVVSGGAGSFTYQWYSNTVNVTNNGTDLGVADGAQTTSYTPPTNTPGTVYYYMQASFAGNGCGVATSSAYQLTTSYLAKPSDIVITTASATLCKGLSASLHATLSNASVIADPVFNWYADANFTTFLYTGADYNSPLLNTTTTYYVKVSGSNACENLTGDGQSQTITVTAQAPEVIQPADLINCAGIAITPIVFASTLSATTYTWSNNKTAIGLDANGTGDIASFTTVNNSLVNDVATITVTPFANGCTGIAKSFTLTIVPNALVNDAVLSVCSGGQITYTPDNVPAGKKYSWVIATLPAGVTGAAANAVSQSSFAQTLVNTTNLPLAVVYTVTPDGCSARSFSLTVMVNPVPRITNQTISNMICSESGFSFVPPVNIAQPGTTYTWGTPSDAPAGSIIGGKSQNNQQLAISDDLLTNSITASANAIYLVTPYSPAAMGGCSGTLFSLVVSVSPKPVLTVTSAGTICNNTQAVFNPSSATAGVSYVWTRAATSNISNPAASGTGGFSEQLHNTGMFPVLVNYNYILTVNGCSNTQTVQVIVQPDAVLSSPTALSICSGSIFNYIPSSVSNGVDFIWSRPVVSGIKNTVNAGTSDIFETLVNTTNAPVTVVYYFTLSVGGCPHTQQVAVVVNPTPVVSESIDQAVCNGTALQINFSGSPIANTSYEWTNTNINIGLASSGKGDIAFTAGNELSLSQTAAISVIPVVNGCSGTAKSFNIVVYPSPDLSSSLTPPSICSNTVFNYTPRSNTAGTVFSWTRSIVPGIVNPAASGNGTINETLVNNTTDPVTVAYAITLSANGCAAKKMVYVSVNPTPAVTNPGNQVVCNNTLKIVNFSGSTVPGTIYSWTNSNVSVGLAASGNGDIFFNTDNRTTDSTVATIKVTPEVNGCKGVTESFTLTVNPTLKLTTTLTPAAVCSNSRFTYVPQVSGDSNAVVTWSRASVFGISNKPATGTNAIDDTLINTTNSPVMVTYVYTIKNRYCSNIQEVVVQVNPSVRMTNIQPGLTNCSNASFIFIPVFNATGIEYKWTRAAVAGISNTDTSGIGDINEVLVNNTDVPIDVQYRYSLKVGATCNNEQIVTVSVKPTPRLLSAVSYVACSNTPIAYIPLSSMPGTGFSWSRTSVNGITNGSSSGFGSITENLVNTTNSAITVPYVITLLGINGCVSVATINVTVNPSPTVFVIPDQSVCAGSNSKPVIFGGSLAGTVYNWTNSEPAIGLPVSGSGNITSFAGTNGTPAPLTGYIQVTPDINGCKGNTITVTRISINPPVSGNFIQSAPSAACPGQPVGPLVSSAPLGGDGFSYAFQWLISSDNISYTAIPSVSAQGRRFTASAQANESWYKMQVSSGGCVSISDSAKVKMGKTPVLTVTNRDNYTISIGNSTQVVVTGADSYVWTPPTSVSDPFIASPLLSPVADTKYIVTGTSAEGCSASDTITIHVVNGFSIVANNILTPNGDGYNDTWEIKNISYYPSNKITIYNTNSVLVKTLNAYTGGWNGTTDSGAKLATGVYYYIIKLTTPTGEVIVRGSLTILN